MQGALEDGMTATVLVGAMARNREFDHLTRKPQSAIAHWTALRRRNNSPAHQISPMTPARDFWVEESRNPSYVGGGIEFIMKIISWFQVPAVDLDRAVRFYEAVLHATFHRMEDPMCKHAFFAMDALESLRTGGELYQSAQGKPSGGGTLVYFTAPDGVDAALSRVEQAGGKIVMPKTSIGQNGFIALILDTEGNKIGLHST